MARRRSSTTRLATLLSAVTWAKSVKPRTRNSAMMPSGTRWIVVVSLATKLPSSNCLSSAGNAVSVAAKTIIAATPAAKVRQ